MANTPQVEHLWLNFSDSGEDGVVPADHDARIVGPIANAVAPWDVSSPEITYAKDRFFLYFFQQIVHCILLNVKVVR